MLLPPLFWAGNAIAGRAAVGEMPPIALAFWRWLFAFLLLLPIGLPHVLRQRHQIRRQWPLLCVLSASSVTAYNVCLYLALTTTTALNATLVSAAIPIAILLLSWAWLRQSISRRQMGGVLLSLGGVLLVIGRGDLATLLGLQLHAGDLWVLAAAATWTFFSVLLRRHPTGLDPLAFLTVQVGLGLVFLCPLYGGELASGATFQWSWRSIGLVAYVAIFPSALAYAFWNRGVAELGPSVAAQYTNLIPLITAFLATLLLCEHFAWFHAVGLVMILGGIWLATVFGVQAKVPEIQA